MQQRRGSWTGSRGHWIGSRQREVVCGALQQRAHTLLRGIASFLIRRSQVGGWSEPEKGGRDRGSTGVGVAGLDSGQESRAPHRDGSCSMSCQCCWGCVPQSDENVQ